MSKSTVFEKFVKGTPFAFRKISDFSKRDPLYGNPIQKVAIALSKFHVFSSPKIRIFSTKCTVKLDSRFRSIENLDRARFSNLEISDLSRSRISRNLEISRGLEIRIASSSRFCNPATDFNVFVWGSNHRIWSLRIRSGSRFREIQSSISFSRSMQF